MVDTGPQQSCSEARKENETEAVYNLDRPFGGRQGEVLCETGIEQESARHLGIMIMSKDRGNNKKEEGHTF